MVKRYIEKLLNNKIIKKLLDSRAVTFLLNNRVTNYIKKNKWLRNLIDAVTLLIIAFVVTFLCIDGYIEYRSNKAMSNLQSSVREARLQSANMPKPETTYERNVSANSNEKSSVSANNISNNSISSNSINSSPVLDIYGQIKSENENFYGWITIEDTGIDYPIMQGPDNKFYLSHDIDNKQDKHGMLILDDNCSDEFAVPDYIVYGHNINGGKYFGELTFYKDRGYYEYHPVVIFDSIYEMREFEIFAVLNTTVSEAQDEHQLFTTWNFDNETDYNNMVSWAKSASLYETDYTPVYGDAILTLITCEHSTSDGRFVVMAAKHK